MKEAIDGVNPRRFVGAVLNAVEEPPRAPAAVLGALGVIGRYSV